MMEKWEYRADEDKQRIEKLGGIYVERPRFYIVRMMMMIMKGMSFLEKYPD